MASPVTVDVQQITDDFPQVAEMSGVALIVYWSTLCPSENHCDFSLIRKTLDFWRKQNKQVILSVATVGLPMETIDGSSEYAGATPAWLLEKIETYTEPSRTISSVNPAPKVVTRYPSYFDPKFASAIDGLVHQLAQFDGDPALAQMRISTGLLGEDNPNVDGYRSRDPNFSEARWIQFSRKMLSIYERHFHRTQLELDIGYISWARVVADPATQQAADAFIDELIKDHVFLAFNGLESDTIAAIRNENISQPLRGPSRSLSYLLKAKERGGAIGLEAAGPLQAQKMDDPQAIIEALRLTSPDRLVLFGTDAGILNLHRLGDNNSNKSSGQAVKSVRQTIEERIDKLMSFLNGE